MNFQPRNSPGPHPRPLSQRERGVLQIYSVVTTIFRDASILPYSPSVSYCTVMVNVSLLPAKLQILRYSPRVPAGAVSAKGHHALGDFLAGGVRDRD